MKKHTLLKKDIFFEIKELIAAAREKVAIAINAELSLLYWQIGTKIRAEILKYKRAKYGQRVVEDLAKKLTLEYGQGWSTKQLRHCLRTAEIFPDEAIVSALRRQLSWTHIKTLIYIEDPLKREFYIKRLT